MIKAFSSSFDFRLRSLVEGEKWEKDYGCVLGELDSILPQFPKQVVATESEPLDYAPRASVHTARMGSAYVMSHWGGRAVGFWKAFAFSLSYGYHLVCI